MDKAENWNKIYKAKIHGLRELYDAYSPFAKMVAVRAEGILRQSISDHNLKCEVASRVKDFNSFRVKFRKKYLQYIKELNTVMNGEPYQIDHLNSKLTNLFRDPFSEITDIIGVRCIGLFSNELYPFDKMANNSDPVGLSSSSESDLFKLHKIVVNRFDDSEKSGPEPAPVSDLKFAGGYRSVHYDLKLKPDSVVNLLEKELLTIPFELQIRTYSQHLVNDVSHFLSYKADDLFFPMSEFTQEAERLQKELTLIQLGIDNLYLVSRKKFDALLMKAEQGNLAELLDLPISPNTLKIYSIFEFVVLKDRDIVGLPTKVSDVTFSDLWLLELCDGLRQVGINKISEVRLATMKGLGFAAYYSRKAYSRKTIFKKKDLTDALSKCLLFGEPKLRSVYPVLRETESAIEEYELMSNQKQMV